MDENSFRLRPEQLARYRELAGDGVFRLSVGLEDADDLECVDAWDNAESDGSDCGDGADNDGDGRFGEADPVLGRAGEVYGLYLLAYPLFSLLMPWGARRGYNLIRQSARLAELDQADLQWGREALLEKLAAYKKLKGIPITVVFDGTRAPTSAPETMSSPSPIIEFRCNP